MIVLDTNALIFWTLDSNNLSEPAVQAIARSERRVVSSISIWEIGLKAKQAKLNLPLSIDSFVDRLKAIKGFEIAPVDERTWLQNLALDWDHKDPADRTIVATAMLLSCPLVSADRAIRAFYDGTIW